MGVSRQFLSCACSVREAHETKWSQEEICLSFLMSRLYVVLIKSSSYSSTKTLFVAIIVQKEVLKVYLSV